MTANSSNKSTSIFQGGKLKPGIYKIQNLLSETYLDVLQHSKELCCRPARDLEDGKGLWEVRSFGAGYTVQRVDPGKPEQFVTPAEGINGGTPVYVTSYPVAWRVEAVNDGLLSGFEYLRFYWGATQKTWDLHCGQRDDGTKVHIFDDSGQSRQIWRLIPVRTEDASTPQHLSSESLAPGFLPPYSGDATGESSTRAHHAESDRDDFGTIVTEVTTVTTRKRYRVQDT